MSNVLIVHVINRQQNLLEDVRCLGFVESLDVHHAVEELAALQQLGSNIKALVVLKNLIH